MTTKHPLLDGTLVDADLFQIAAGVVMEAKSLKSVLRHKDVIDAIAKALQDTRNTEYNRCVTKFGTDEEMGYQVGA